MSFGERVFSELTIFLFKTNRRPPGNCCIRLPGEVLQSLLQTLRRYRSGTPAERQRPDYQPRIMDPDSPEKWMVCHATRRAGEQDGQHDRSLFTDELIIPGQYFPGLACCIASDANRESGLVLFEYNSATSQKKT